MLEKNTTILKSVFLQSEKGYKQINIAISRTGVIRSFFRCDYWQSTEVHLIV